MLFVSRLLRPYEQLLLAVVEEPVRVAQPPAVFE